MRKLLGGYCTFVMLSWYAGSLHAAEQDELRAVIDKAIKATGGEAKLAKFKAQTWKATGTYYGMGNGLPYTGNYAVQWPNQFRMEIENVFTIVLNVDQAWVKAGDNTKEFTKEELANQKEDHYAGWVTTLIPLKDKEFKFSPIGESKIDGRDAVGITVSRKDHKDVNLFFDKENGLLVKSEYQVKASEQGGKEVNQEDFYTNYQEVEGIKIPMKIVIKREGKPYVDAENSEVKPVEKLDDSVFAKP